MKTKERHCCDDCADYDWYYDWCCRFKCKADAREVHDCFREHEKKQEKDDERL